MNIKSGMFACKLYELEKQYALLKSRIQLCREQDHEKLIHGIDVLQDACKTNDLVLRSNVEGSKSPFVAELAKAQFSYSQEASEDITRLMTQCKTMEEMAEALTIYAESAIDFATQSMNHALLASMYAVDAHLLADTEKEEEG